MAGLIREPLIQSGTATNLAQATAESRADMVGLYIKDLELRINVLTSQLEEQSEAEDLSYAALSFPDADAISLIPLGDLGPVSISPGIMACAHISISILSGAPLAERIQRPNLSIPMTALTHYSLGDWASPLEAL